MTSYFVFSDEAGAYKRRAGKNYLKRHPYYCRSGILISTVDYMDIRKKVEKLREKLEIPPNIEVKWF